MSAIYSPDNSYEKAILSDPPLSLRAAQIRQERTGYHAWVGILLGDSILAYDTFNIGRNEERQRLVKGAFGRLSAPLRETITTEWLAHELDVFCLEVPRSLDSQYVPELLTGRALPLTYPLQPYLLDGGGTMLFGAPGEGKSTVSLIWGTCVHYGLNSYWHTERREVLYVNLERSRESIDHKILGIRNALPIEGWEGLRVLSARGRSLADTARSVARYVERQNIGLVVWDSISRSGMGSMNDDETGNRTIDAFSAASATWLAIGHTNRAGEDHVIGTQMWDAGQDIGVSLRSVAGEGETGISLRMTKANDTAKAPPEYIRLRWDEDGLTAVERASAADFPDIAPSRKPDQVIDEYLRSVGSATQKEIVEATGVPQQTVSLALGNGKYVVLPPIEGHGKGRPALRWARKATEERT